MITEHLLGWFFLSVIFIYIFLLKEKYSEVKNCLLIAFILRALCVVLDQYELIRLPDGYADASKFEATARLFSREYGLIIIFDFFKTDAFLISRIISIFYTILGESKMMAQSISVALGTASVYLVYKLCLILWDNRSAKKAAWLTSIFPILILYSSLTLREVYIIFFLLFGLIGIAKFINNNSFISLFQTLISFAILIFFHGPLAIGAFVFLFYLVTSLIKNQLFKLYHLKIDKLSLFLILFSLIPLILFLSNNIEIPYIGGIQTLFNLSGSIPKINNYMFDTAAYPSWLLINNNYELFTKGIFKILYFLYGPFVWDIKTSYHLIGLLDGSLYIILTIFLLKNWQTIWANPVGRFFILLLLSYIIIYGISVGNFGTGIRHRSKFVIILIILAAPKLHKFVFYFKKI
mgnify:CR=1 FL=1